MVENQCVKSKDLEYESLRGYRFLFPHACDKMNTSPLFTLRTLSGGPKAISFVANEGLTSVLPLSTAKWRRVLPSTSTLFSMSFISFCLDLTVNDIMRNVRAVNRIPPLPDNHMTHACSYWKIFQGKSRMMAINNNATGLEKAVWPCEMRAERCREKEEKRRWSRGQNAYRIYWLKSGRKEKYLHWSSCQKQSHPAPRSEQVHFT